MTNYSIITLVARVYPSDSKQALPKPSIGLSPAKLFTMNSEPSMDVTASAGFEGFGS